MISKIGIIGGGNLGMAIAEAWLAARYNRAGHNIVDHYVYSICGDGDLMEGVTQEAASLAGHLRLGRLIYLYDQNHISLAGGTDLCFTEDVAERFQAYGWHTRSVKDGNDTEEVAAAIEEAQRETNRPSLILSRTRIGYGSPKKQDNFSAHGNPLGEEELQATKKALPGATVTPSPPAPGEPLRRTAAEPPACGARARAAARRRGSGRASRPVPPARSSRGSARARLPAEPQAGVRSARRPLLRER